MLSIVIFEVKIPQKEIQNIKLSPNLSFRKKKKNNNKKTVVFLVARRPVFDVSASGKSKPQTFGV